MTALRKTKHAVSGGYEINVAETGGGPTVVCIHGSGPGASGASNFGGNIAAFANAGYRVVVPDLIGYGESSKPEGIDYTLQLFTDTLYEALKAAGVSQTSIVGNSLGGAIALQLALDHPGFVTSLILLAPGSIEEVSIYLDMPGIKNMGALFLSPDFNFESQRKIVHSLVHPDFAPSISNALVEERFKVAVTQPKDVLRRMKTPNLGPRLKELALPILVFWGQDDQFLPVASGSRFLEDCRDARVMTFSRTGHWVQVERRAEFNAHTVAFLNEQR